MRFAVLWIKVVCIVAWIHIAATFIYCFPRLFGLNRHGDPLTAALPVPEPEPATPESIEARV